MWEVNTEAVFHCWCRVGCLKLQSSTWRRANALAHDDGTFTCHFGVTYVDLHLMGMYVCMYGQYHHLWSSVVLTNRWLVAADVGSKYRGGFSLLVPCGMIETTIQHLASCQCTGARRRYVSLLCHFGVTYVDYT